MSLFHATQVPHVADTALGGSSWNSPWTKVARRKQLVRTQLDTGLVSRRLGATLLTSNHRGFVLFSSRGHFRWYTR